jgi:hypothetical protein
LLPKAIASAAQYRSAPLPASTLSQLAAYQVTKSIARMSDALFGAPIAHDDDARRACYSVPSL